MAAIPRRFRVKLALFALLVATGPIGWQLTRPPDPLYQGHHLSWWLRNGGSAFTREDYRAMGPAAIQYLAYTVEHGHVSGHPSWGKFGVWWHSADNQCRDWLHVPRDEIDERWFALQAVWTIGPEAVPTIPALVKAVQGGDDHYLYGTWDLIRIGPAARPAILKILLGPRSPARDHLISGLGSYFLADPNPSDPSTLGPAIKSDPTTLPYIDYLLILCRDPDPQVRLVGLIPLGLWAERIGFMPNMEPVVPYAIESLSAPIPDQRVAAMVFLELLGKRSAPHLPRILALLDDPDPKVVRQATIALFYIDPEDKAPVPRMHALSQSKNLYYRTFSEEYLYYVGVDQ